jgi:hypothetical protein
VPTKIEEWVDLAEETCPMRDRTVRLTSLARASDVTTITWFQTVENRNIKELGPISAATQNSGKTRIGRPYNKPSAPLDNTVPKRKL